MIIEELKKEQIACMKNGDASRLSVVRYILSEVKNKEIELRASGGTVGDEQALRVMKSQIKRRTKNLELFEKSGRQELLEKEKFEISMIQEYFDMFSEKTGVTL